MASNIHGELFMVVPLFKMGLEKTLYKAPTQHPTRYVWEKQTFYTNAYLTLRMDRAHANNEAGIKLLDNFQGATSIARFALQIKRPGIYGARRSRRGRALGEYKFPVEGNRFTERADKEALFRFSREQMDNEEDKYSRTNSSSFQDRVERLEEYASRYLAEKRGHAGRARKRFGFEEEARRDRRRRRSSRRGEISSDAIPEGGFPASGSGSGGEAHLEDDARSVRSSRSRRSVRSSRSTSTARTIDPRKQKHYAYFRPGWPYHFVQEVRYQHGRIQIQDDTGVTLRMLADTNVDANARAAWRRTVELPPERIAHDPEAVREYMVNKSKQPFTAILDLDVAGTDLDLSMCIHARFMPWSAPELRFKFSSIEDLVVCSDRFTDVLKADGNKLQNEDVTAQLCVRALFLEPDEKEVLKNRGYENVIVDSEGRAIRHEKVPVDEKLMLVRDAHHFTMKDEIRRIPLTAMLGSTVSMSAMVRRECCIKDGDIFNGWGQLGGHAVESASITMNRTSNLQPSMPRSFWADYVPMVHKAHSPELQTIHWSAADTMRSHKLDASINFSRFDALTWDLKLQDGLLNENVDVTVLRNHYIIAKYEPNMCRPIVDVEDDEDEMEVDRTPPVTPRLQPLGGRRDADILRE